MSEVPTLSISPESTLPAKHYRGPDPIIPEDAIRLLQEEIERSIDLLVTHPVNGASVTGHINILMKLLTGKSTKKRKKAYGKPEKPVLENYEPRDTIPMFVSVSSYRRQLLRKGNCTCSYCGCKLGLDSSTIDHVIPKAQGGKDIPSNLILSCQRCNQIKGSRTPQEWAADILAVVE